MLVDWFISGNGGLIMLVFIAISVVLFSILAFIWSKDDWLNLAVKMIFTLSSVYGLVLLWPTLTNMVN